MSNVQPVEPVPPISPPVQLAHGTGSSRKMPSSAKQSLINLSLGMGIMLAALSGGAYLMMTNKDALLGGKASVDKQSSFSFTAPTQVKPGEEFVVDVMLDASADPEYTISGADAVIQYSFTPEQQPLGGTGSSVTGDNGTSGISWEEQQSIDVSLRRAYPMFALVKTEPGTIFDSYPQDPSLPVIPVPNTSPVPKIPCGGINGDVSCPDDMFCQMGMRGVPDASGYCVRSPTVVNVLSTTTSESKKLALSPPPPPPPTRPPSTPGPMVIQGTTTISGIKNYSVDDKGYFMGFSGKGVFVRLTFVANTMGKIELKFAYNGATATDDSNINGFSKIIPVNIQKSVERLLTAPTSLQVVVAKQTWPECDEPPSCPAPPDGCRYVESTTCSCGKLNCSPPSVSCITNAECDRGYECYQPGMPPCKEGLACIQVMPARYCRKIPTPTGTPNTSSTPIPSPTILPTTTPRPLNKVSWKTSAITLDADDFEISINHRNGTVKKYYAQSGNVTVHSDMNPLKPTLEVQWTENNTPMHLFIYFQNLGSSWMVSEMRTYDGSESGEWIYYKNFDIKSLFNEIFISPKFSVTSSNRGSLQDGSTVTGTIMFTNLRLQDLLSTKPSPTPVPDKPVINIALALEGRTNHSTKALVYRVVPGGERLLDQVRTDSNGNGSIQVSDLSLYSDQNLRLFVEVPGYLRKYQQSLVRSSAIQTTVGFSKPGVITANFGLMTAGDVHIDDATGFGDHQINSVDVADMYTQWSTATGPEGSPEFSGLSGDLNGDEIVNNRDYAILMMNFGKKAGVVKLGAGSGEMCGGIANIQCVPGLICNTGPGPAYPDQSGICTLDNGIR